MAKRKKPLDPELGNALNATEDLKQQIVMNVAMLDTEGDPHVGVMVLETPYGHYQFFVSDVMANNMVQVLRDFIAGDVEMLP